LYFVRHAIAVDRQTAGLAADAARALTPEGIEKFRRGARALRRLDVSLDEIWTSPLLRARQTAKILAEALDARDVIRVVPALAPDGCCEDLIPRLAETGACSCALVGHMPDLGRLAGLLLGGPRDMAFRLKKGGVLCVDIHGWSPPRGEVRWLLTPRALTLML